MVREPISKSELMRKIVQIGEYLKPTKGIKVSEKTRKELLAKQEYYVAKLNQA